MLNLFVNKNNTVNASHGARTVTNNNINTINRGHTNTSGSTNARSRFSVHIYNARNGVANSRRLQDLNASSPQELADSARALIRREVSIKFHPSEAATLNLGSMTQVNTNMYVLTFTIQNLSLGCTDTYKVQLGRY